jgi:hypothetical protein
MCCEHYLCASLRGDSTKHIIWKNISSKYKQLVANTFPWWHGQAFEQNNKIKRPYATIWWTNKYDSSHTCLFQATKANRSAKLHRWGRSAKSQKPSLNQPPLSKPARKTNQSLMFFNQTNCARTRCKYLTETDIPLRMTQPSYQLFWKKKQMVS